LVSYCFNKKDAGIGRGDKMLKIIVSFTLFLGLMALLLYVVEALGKVIKDSK